jgi:NAD(P)H-nitrite reductase large subunit
MAVSGCHLSCFESWGRDIGLIGLKYGWQLVIAWNVAAAPRIAQEVASGLEDADILDVVDKIVQCYQEKVQKGERLGKNHRTDRSGSPNSSFAANGTKRNNIDVVSASNSLKSSI